MVVVEANAPSGYTIDEEELRHLTTIKDLQRVEVTKGGTVADIYINSVSDFFVLFVAFIFQFEYFFVFQMSSVPMCFNISSERVFQVAEQKPAIIIVYDYYAPSRRVSFYFLKNFL